jgi:hypothetical protein
MEARADTGISGGSSEEVWNRVGRLVRHRSLCRCYSARAGRTVEEPEWKVVSVDASKNMIAIKDETGADKAIQVAASTRITRGGKEISLADIKAGDRVSYLLDEGGEAAPVKSISVMPGVKE